MPTYEYVCTDCQNAWEEIQKISEAPIDVCPKCQKTTARRQISGGNFILKGGGWYADLYSSSKPKADTNGKTESKAATNTESKTEAKPAETKSEAKTETKPSTPPATKSD